MSETSTTSNSDALRRAEWPAISPGVTPTAAWVALTTGALSIVVGVAMFVWPDVTLRVVAVIVGLWVLLGGIARILGAFLPGAGLGRQLLSGIVGVLFVIVGVACLRDLVKALVLLAVIIALAYLLGGLAWLALATQTSGGARVGLVVVGLLSVGVGVVILALPELSLTALVYLTAATAIVLGIGELATGFQLRRALTGQPAGA